LLREERSVEERSVHISKEEWHPFCWSGKIKEKWGWYLLSKMVKVISTAIRTGKWEMWKSLIAHCSIQKAYERSGQGWTILGLLQFAEGNYEIVEEGGTVSNKLCLLQCFLCLKSWKSPSKLDIRNFFKKKQETGC
jgi:hypothetical protein